METRRTGTVITRPLRGRARRKGGSEVLGCRYQWTMREASMDKLRPGLSVLAGS